MNSFAPFCIVLKHNNNNIRKAQNWIVDKAEKSWNGSVNKTKQGVRHFADTYVTLITKSKCGRMNRIGDNLYTERKYLLCYSAHNWSTWRISDNCHWNDTTKLLSDQTLRIVEKNKITRMENLFKSETSSVQKCCSSDSTYM